MNLDETYWDSRYEQRETGWDAGKITAPIKEFVDQITDKNLRILIPGAGNGYEAEYLHLQGFKRITVIDLSSIALENIKTRVPDFPAANLLQGDFFHHRGNYDLILEQTFFCALNPSLRPQYAEKMSDLLVDEGLLCGVLFDFPLTDEGPPFGGSLEEYLRLFTTHFDTVRIERCYNSIPPRAGSELWIEIEK